VKAVRARWASASFLAYAGAFTVLIALFSLLGVISSEHGKGAFAGWTVVFFLVIEACAFALKRRGRPVAAGLFAFVAVGMFGVMLGAFFDWFGWLHGGGAPFSGFHVGLLAVELLTLVAAFAALRVFRFPLIVAIIAGLGWYFVTDLLSSGGNWTAVVTLLVGIVLLLVGFSLDGGDSRPYGFWVHFVAGLTVGGSLLYFWHSGDFRWTLIIIASLVFIGIGIGSAAKRSIWTVLGAIGLALATGHFALDRGINLSGEQVSRPENWVGPVAYLCLGFFYVLLGLMLSRRGKAAERV
jgi:hypothetical protein